MAGRPRGGGADPPLRTGPESLPPPAGSPRRPVLRVKRELAAGRGPAAGRRNAHRPRSSPEAGLHGRQARCSFLIKLGGIWEIASGVTVPKALPTGMKRIF